MSDTNLLPPLTATIPIEITPPTPQEAADERAAEALSLYTDLVLLTPKTAVDPILDRARITAFGLAQSLGSLPKSAKLRRQPEVAAEASTIHALAAEAHAMAQQLFTEIDTEVTLPQPERSRLERLPAMLAELREQTAALAPEIEQVYRELWTVSVAATEPHPALESARQRVLAVLRTLDPDSVPKPVEWRNRPLRPDQERWYDEVERQAEEL